MIAGLKKMEYLFSGKTAIFICLFILLSNYSPFAQRPSSERFNRRGQMPNNSITGMIVDGKTNNPVEYATIIVFNKLDSSKVSGTSSNEQGRFFIKNIKEGEYYLTITFLGYETKTIDNIEINSSKKFARLRKISLIPTTVSIEGINVTAEKMPVEYKIDKKIINVDRQLTATSGSAVDVLENAPSVSVDIDGNVQLRGSSNFTVLIDGQPSILDANDALEQIPASTIDNIEIITNPSAKYDPDGTSGIINIILKKNKLIGISGVVNSNGGSNDQYGSSIILNYRNGKYNSFLNLSYNKRYFPGTYYSENISTLNNTTSYLNSNGINKRDMKGVGGRGGIDISLTKNDNLSFGFRYGNRDMSRGSELSYLEWSNLDSIQYPYSSDNMSDRSGDFYAINGHNDIGRGYRCGYFAAGIA